MVPKENAFMKGKYEDEVNMFEQIITGAAGGFMRSAR